jgi:putative hemolysin
MTHRTEILGIDVEQSYAKTMEMAISEKYSRFPVYEENIDNIIGVLHTKDLLKLKSSREFKMADLMRPPYFVPESQKIDEVLKELKKTQNHLAVVVDEYGGTAGIITMEDILEELVGSILDEYDTEEEEALDIIQTGDSVYEIDGMAELEQINDYLKLDIPTDKYDTLNGFVLSELGYLPDESEHPSFVYDSWNFEVLSTNEKVITKIKVSKLPDNSEEPIN